MLVAEQLVRSFGRVAAVRGVSFAVRPGEVTALLGPNGAGKTTTIRMLVGLLAPHAGRALLGGDDVTAASGRARRRLGYLPESAPAYPEMRVQGYVRARASLCGLSRRDAARATDATLDRCGLRDAARRRIGTLSKGYRQRVGLAAALVHGPEVVILDEPTNALDPAQVRDVRALIRSIAGGLSGGGPRCAVLFSTHVLGEVEACCDRALMMAGGRVLADEPVRGAGGAAQSLRVAWAQGPTAADLLAHLAAAGVAQPLNPPPPAGDTRVRTADVTLARPGAEGVDAVARAVLAAGGQLAALEPRGETLEERFLRVVAAAGGGA